MISDEIRNGIEAKSDIHESKNNTGMKENNYTRIDKDTPAPRNMYDLKETWSNKQNIQYLYVQIQGRQKATQWVCKIKEKVHMHIMCEHMKRNYKLE